MAPADRRVDVDPRPMPAELQYLLIVVALFALLLLSGVPGQGLQEVGERATGTPQRAWAAQWSARVQAEQASQAAAATPVPPADVAAPQR